MAGSRRGRGASRPPSPPVAEQATPLDRLVLPMIRARPGQSGLMLLDGNLDAFAIRALAARRAGRSLDLQYYIWRNDLTGRLLAGELVEAADRGVRVRLLLDDINTRGYDKTLLALDAHPSIAVRLFNPSRNRDGALRRGLEMLLRAVTVTRRMHNKAWIADGRLAVVGGRNVGDAYFDAAATANFRDLDLLVLGPAVQQAEAIFDSYWNSSAVIPIAGARRRPRATDLPAIRRALASSAGAAGARPYLDPRRRGRDGSREADRRGTDPVDGEGKDRLGPAGESHGSGQGALAAEHHPTPRRRRAIATSRSSLPTSFPGEAGTSELLGWPGKASGFRSSPIPWPRPT